MSVGNEGSIDDDWGSRERRVADRRDERSERQKLENTWVSNNQRKKSDRRKSQHCFVCGDTFKPTAEAQRVCRSCKMSGLRMGQPVGTLF